MNMQPLSSSASTKARANRMRARDATFAFRLKDCIFATSPSRISILELSRQYEVYTVERWNTMVEWQAETGPID
jgi:hypothetical protein